jgi:hypothetical protein
LRHGSAPPLHPLLHAASPAIVRPITDTLPYYLLHPSSRSEKAGGLPSISVFGKPAGLNGSFTLQQHSKPGHGPGHGPPHHKHGPAQHGPQQQHHDPLDGPAGPSAPQPHWRTQQGEEDILPGLPEVLAGTFGADSDGLAGTVDNNTLPPINQSFGGLSGKTQPPHHAHSHNLCSHAAAGHHGGQHGQGQGASTGNSTSRRMSQSLPAVGGAGHHHQQAQQHHHHQAPGLASEPSASKLAGGAGGGRAKGGMGGPGGPGAHVLAAGKVSRAQANAASTLTGGFGGSLQANLSVSSIFKSGPGAGPGGLKASGSGKYVSPYSQRTLGI